MWTMKMANPVWAKKSELNNKACNVDVVIYVGAIYISATLIHSFSFMYPRIWWFVPSLFHLCHSQDIYLIFQAHWTWQIRIWRGIITTLTAPLSLFFLFRKNIGYKSLRGLQKILFDSLPHSSIFCYLSSCWVSDYSHVDVHITCSYNNSELIFDGYSWLRIIPKFSVLYRHF